MGDVLVKYYEFVRQEAGLNGAMRLSMRTKISSNKAPHAPDSVQNLRLFRAAVQEITGQDVDFQAEDVKDGSQI